MEDVALITLHGGARNEILSAQKSVFEYFGYNLNQVEAPFKGGMSHGQCIDWFLSNRKTNLPNIVSFWDSDSIPLKSGAIESMVDKVRDGNSIAGCVQNSGHLLPNNNVFHPYCGAFSLFFSMELYIKLGKPTFNHIDNYADTAENLTFECEKQGKGVYLLYPSSMLDNEYDLPHNLKFGRGTVYGPNLFYHQFRADLPQSKYEFLDKCAETLRNN